jgi:hypothetical protein
LILAACSSSPTEVTPAQDSYPAVAPAPEPPKVAARDQCGAAEHQGLVGKLRTEIPVPIDPTKQRVACTSCPVTMDFSAERLNFFFDAATGVIKEVRCG